MTCQGLIGGKATLAILFLVGAFNANAQKLFTMSLDEFLLNTDEINFSVSEVFDARKDKKSLGVVQTGLNNRPRFVVFEKPDLVEVEDLLKNSGLYSEERGLAIRFTVLKISENTTMFTETAKAEISIDFFIRFQNLYYYVSSVFASAEPEGLGVTYKQAENLVLTLEDALISFSKQKHEAKPELAFTKEDLLDPYLLLRDPDSMPILTAGQYKDGYFVSYEEFINNEPSISIDCKVKFSSPVTIKCGEQVTDVPNLYGFAQDDKLYILYHQEFHELVKRNGTFYFNGPMKMSRTSSDDTAEAYLGPAAIARTFLSSRTRYSDLYMIDMATGTVRNITGF